MTAEDMYKVGKVMLEKALAGDVQAAKFLASYVIGRPTPAADPDRLDLEELRQYQEERAATRTLNDDLEGIAPGLACHLISTVRPIKTVNLASMVGESVRTGVVPGEDHPSAPPLDEGPRSDAVAAAQDQSPDPRQAGASGANGGRPASAVNPGTHQPSSIGDNGPAVPAPASRPAPDRASRPPLPGSPGADPRYPNGDNGPSRSRRPRK